MDINTFVSWIKRSCPICDAVWAVATLPVVPGNPFITFCPECKSYLGKEFSVHWKLIILALGVVLVSFISSAMRLGGWIGFLIYFAFVVAVIFIVLPILYFRFAKIFPLRVAQPGAEPDAGTDRKLTP